MARESWDKAAVQPVDGMYIRGLTPPILRIFDRNMLLSDLARRGVRLTAFDFSYKESLDDILERAGQEFEGSVVVGASAGGVLATLLGLRLGVPIVTISSRRREGDYPLGHRHSLERRAKGAPAFAEGVRRLDALPPLAPAQAALITDIRPTGGDSIVPEAVTHLRPDVRLVEVSPGWIAVGGLDHAYSIRMGMKLIEKDTDGQVVVREPEH